MGRRTSLLRHVFQNAALISLSLSFLPLDSLIVLTCLSLRVLSYLLQTLHLVPRAHVPLPPAQQRTVLVSSTAMSKGLSLARAFHAAGHRVIGLDFSHTPFAHARIPSPGRFSRALRTHYEVPLPASRYARLRYEGEVVRIVKAERVDLWVCVSGVATTEADAHVAAAVRRETRCRVFQPRAETCALLHDKHEFVRFAAGAGLGVPRTHRVASREAAQTFFDARAKETGRYVLKSIGLDDAARADTTRLPKPTRAETAAFLRPLEITAERPWVVQEFVAGNEFCTHAVVVRGEVRAFVACPSSELLMHYAALPGESALSRAMLAWTRRLVRALDGGELTAQVSLDFLVPSGPDRRPLLPDPRASAAGTQDAHDIPLYAIECNPRTHTAVVLLAAADAPGLANAYLSLLSRAADERDGCLESAPVDARTDHVLHAPESPKPFVYWVGHDLVVSAVLPLLRLLLLRVGIGEAVSTLFWFAVRLVGWRDATFAFTDPLPWWWLYHGFWPAVFAASLLTGRRWSRVNVSTGKVFESA